MYRGANGFGRWANLLMNIAINVVLNIVIPLIIESANGITGILTPVSFIQGCVLGICVGYLIGDFVPAPVWGMKLVSAFKIKNKFLSHLVQSATIALVMVTIMAFALSFINNIVAGGMMGTVNFFLLIYPGALLSGFIAIFVALPFCNKLASALSGFDPSKPQPNTSDLNAVVG